MVDNRVISLCLTNYNRVDLLIESFQQIYNDERISEIVISDDCSDIEIVNKLEDLFELLPKIRMVSNDYNQDCYKNKALAIGLSKNKFAILADSDNIFTTDYLDRIFEIKEWEEKTAYLPSFAQPQFDYREFEGLTITKDNVSSCMDKPLFRTMCNTMNYFADRDFYLECFDESVNPHTEDSIFINYKWLKNGGKLFVVPNLYYQHTVHMGSHYRLNHHKVNGFDKLIDQKLKALPNEI